MINQGDLPDLPGLENIETRGGNMLAILSLYIGLSLIYTAASLWMLISYRQYLGSNIITLIILMLVLTAWLLFRLLSADYFFSTNREGLTIRGPLRRRFIPWVDIKNAYVTEGLGSDNKIRLETSNGIITFSTGSLHRGNSESLLISSIWQHLRQIGRADQVKLSPTALTFWDHIPDDLPHEINWKSKKLSTYAVILGMFFSILIIGGTIWALWSENPHSPIGLAFRILLSLFVLFGWYCLSRLKFRTARQISLNENRIEITYLLGKAEIYWSEIINAWWGQDYIGIRSTKPSRTTYIQCIIGKDESEKLILALIRRLRTAGIPQLLIIPDWLRFAPSSITITDPTSSVVLKPNKQDKFGILLLINLFSFMLLLMPLNTHPPRIWLAIALLLAMIGINMFIWRVIGLYNITTDDEGIKIRFLSWKRVVYWNEVVSIKPSPVYKEKLRGKKVLKDAKGKTLIQFPPSFGSKEDRAAFNAFVEAKLASSTLREEIAKSWLARPWSPPD